MHSDNVSRLALITLERIFDVTEKVSRVERYTATSFRVQF